MLLVLGIDPRTLTLAAAVISLTLAGILAAVGRMRPMPAGFGAWTASQLLLAAGEALVSCRDLVPDWVSIIGGNAFLVLGFAALAEGFRRFHGLPRGIPAWAEAAVIALFVGVQALLIGRSVNARIVLASCAAALYMATITLQFFRSPEAGRSAGQRVLTALLLVGIALLLVRAVRCAIAPPITALFTEGWTVVIPSLVLATTDTATVFLALLLAFERSEGQLRTALSEVKRLSGLLPICMHCHRIRNDQGYWDELSRYIATHTDAQLSHGICPGCYREQYGEEPPEQQVPAAGDRR